MKKNLRLALYDPYLDILGGGEKHIFSIIEVLAKQNYQPYVFWDKDLSKEISKRFLFQPNIELKFLPNIFKKKIFGLSTLKALQTLKTFDYFFYVTDGSYFISSAKKNYIFAMVPNKKLYQMNLINKIKTTNYQFISNSTFTQKQLKNWGVDSQVIYPYVDQKILSFDIDKPKEKVILSVGRFFSHLHSKRQDIIINLFKKFKQENPMFKDFRLILAGGLKKEDKEYFKELKKLADQDSSIVFKPNISLDELYKLYELSSYFWHFAGYGIDENVQPEKVEHLGIAPLEAMAAGCLTFCYNAGGPKETIKDNETGFLFNNEKELFRKMNKLVKDNELQQIIQKQAKNYVKKHFSYSVFEKNVRIILDFELSF